MKLIEAMKKIKDLQRKAEDLRKKVADCSADLDFETPQYDNQREKVESWLQAHSDIVHEIERLRVAIQATNLATSVTIELNGKEITKTIAAWILRRQSLAALEEQMWGKLTDKGLKDGTVPQSDGTRKDIHVRRYYDPEKRDEKIDLFRSEPLLVDAKLEVINATTDLIE